MTEAILHKHIVYCVVGRRKKWMEPINWRIEIKLAKIVRDTRLVGNMCPGRPK